MKSIISFLMLCSMVVSGFTTESESTQNQVTLTILYDNYLFQEGLASDWGFACLVEGTEKTILFDTGRLGNILLQNISNLEVDLNKVDIIMISHDHGDHTGGLYSVLNQRSDVSVYILESFPQSYDQSIPNRGARTVRVTEPIEICKHVYSTGELRGPANEQSLILDTDDGLVIITGCSHPGIVNIIQRAKEILNKDIYLVFGGFHLMNHSDTAVNQIIEDFRSLGLKKCGATHCTGDRAIDLFKEAYGDDYVPMGVGQVILVTMNTVSVKEKSTEQSYKPHRFELEQNYPNPFNPVTTIKYRLYKPAHIKLSVSDVRGREVKILVDEEKTAGAYEKLFEPSNLASGVYFCTLQTHSQNDNLAGEYIETKKLILLR